MSTLQERVEAEKIRTTTGGVPVSRTMTTAGEVLKDFVRDCPKEMLAAIPREPEQIAEAKKRLRELQEQKYACPICRDGHFVHPLVDGRPDFTRLVSCSCVWAEHERQKKERLIQYCEVPEKGKDMTFDNFKHKPGTKEAYQACLAMAKGEYDKSFLTLVGPSDHGKTHLAIAIVNYRLAENKPAKYIYVPRLLDELREAFGKDGDDSYQSRFETFLEVPFLTMDDLGVESQTPWANEKLDMIINERLMHKLSTVVTTNLPLHPVGNKPCLNFRIASRLERDENKVITMLGAKYSEWKKAK